MSAKVNGGPQERPLSYYAEPKNPSIEEEVSPMRKSNLSNEDDIADIANILRDGFKDIGKQLEDQKDEIASRMPVKPSLTAIIGAAVAVLTVCLIVGAYLVTITKYSSDLAGEVNVLKTTIQNQNEKFINLQTQINDDKLDVKTMRAEVNQLRIEVARVSGRVVVPTPAIP